MEQTTTTMTKEKMQRYEAVRRSGVTNMFAVRTVMGLAGLTKEECFDIMEHYDEYMEKFGLTKKS